MSASEFVQDLEQIADPIPLRAPALSLIVEFAKPPRNIEP